MASIENRPVLLSAPTGVADDRIRTFSKLNKVTILFAADELREVPEARIDIPRGAFSYFAQSRRCGDHSAEIEGAAAHVCGIGETPVAALVDAIASYVAAQVSA